MRFGIRLPVPGPFYAYIPLNRRRYGRRQPSQRWSIFGILMTGLLWYFALVVAAYVEAFLLVVLLTRLASDLVFHTRTAFTRFAARHRKFWSPTINRLKGNS